MPKNRAAEYGVPEDDADDNTVNFASGGDDSEVVDLGGVDENGQYPVIPKGDYVATVDEVEYGISQSKGNKMWTWRFKIEGGDHDGRTLFYHTTFTEQGLPRVKQALVRVGRADLANSRFNPRDLAENGDLIGGRCIIRVVQRPYEGQMRNSIRTVLPYKEGQANETSGVGGSSGGFM
jgi:Protein of unknown function (DUF669)